MLKHTQLNLQALRKEPHSPLDQRLAGITALNATLAGEKNQAKETPSYNDLKPCTRCKVLEKLV